jgi:hypothetical protein
MKKELIAEIVEKTLIYLERSGSDRLAQQYLHYALSGFASECKDLLTPYLERYGIQEQAFTTETAQLLIYREKEVIACFVLDSHANLVGREDPETRCYPNVDLGVFDTSAKISRRHAQIYSLDGRNFWIEDLDSYNGTSLNNLRLAPRHAQPLHDGDEIVFGNTAVTFISPIVGKTPIKPNNQNTIIKNGSKAKPSESIIDASNEETVN